jgi:hypothetical protein
MIDVNKITSTLAKLPDQQLQQYAQMHKNDPYIMALAMSESNRRKEMRAAGQGEMQEQPKVVDQEIARMGDMQGANPEQLARLAQMLDARKEAEYKEFTGQKSQQMPEDMGIGQLPAGDMNFAGGGIVAFADGGDVERYSGEFGSLTGEFSGFGGMSPEQAAAAELRAAEEARRKQLAKLEQQTAFLKAAKAPQAQAAQAQLDALKASMQPKPSPTDPNFRRQEDPRMKPGVAATAQPLITSGTAPTADTGRKGPAAEPVAKKETGFDALLKALDGAPAPASTDSVFSQKITDLTNARVQARREEAEGLDAIHKKFSDIYKGREERLSKREGELGKMKDQNMGLALLQAGAAIMSTPGSLGTAIGRGVDVGSKQYAAGMDKLNAAKEKLSDARDRLDDLNAQRGEMSAREKLKAMSAIKTEEAAGLELLLKADMDMHKISREEALKRLDLRTRIGIAQLQEQGQNVRAAAGNRNNQLEVLRAVEADPRLMAAYRAMQGKNEDVMAQYNDFLKANPTLAMDPQKAMTQFLMSKSVFSQLGAAPVTEKATGPIRKQP